MFVMLRWWPDIVIRHHPALFDSGPAVVPLEGCRPTLLHQPPARRLRRSIEQMTELLALTDAGAAWCWFIARPLLHST